MDIKMGLIMGGTTAQIGNIEVVVGQTVALGDTLLQTETGKGSRPIKALFPCIIEKILCASGDAVSTGDVLFQVTGQEDTQEAQQAVAKRKESMETDLLIIGAGPGGYVAAIHAAQNGLRVVLVEKDQLGGTCLNRGCIPTKALIHSGEVYAQAKKAGTFGIVCKEMALDYPAVQAHKDGVCDQLRQGISFLLSNQGVTLLQGEASFTNANMALVVGQSTETEVTARFILIASGSVPSGLGQLDLSLPVIMDSTAALQRPTLPKSITIIGGGVIGMEFAFCYRNLGVDVQVVEFQPRILPPFDEDVANEVAIQARKEKIRVLTGAGVTNIRMASTGEALVDYVKDGVNETAVSELVLVAVGRRAMIEGLGLEAAGVALTADQRRIAVDENLRTSCPNIYAVGDVSSAIQLAHLASHQGIQAVDAMLGKDVLAEPIPSVVFTKPEVAMTGYSELDCQRDDRTYHVYKVPFSSNGRAKTLGVSTGFVKLLSAEDGTVLGGAVVGPDAAALINTVTLAVKEKLSCDTLAAMIMPHPTTGETMGEAARMFSGKAIHWSE